MKLETYQKWQIFIFAISYLCIAGRHSCLEGWFMVKSDVNDDLNFSGTWLGAMDSTYLFCYAIGNYISGVLGDLFPIHIVVPSGMILGSLCYFIIVFLGYANYGNPYIFVILFGMIGFSLSTVWPCTVSLMGHWFSRKNTGKILGLWSSNSQVGNILGAQMATIILSLLNSSWEIVIIVTTIFLLSIGVIFFFTVKERPDSKWLQNQQVLLDEEKDNSSQEQPSLSFIQAWMLPRVAVYALTYACVKLLNYSMLMWLPFILDKHINVNKNLIGAMANLYDIGGLVGGFIFGWITDRLGYRAPTICSMLLGALPIFGIIQLMTPSTWWMFFFITFLLGCLVSASDNLISGAVAIDLGRGESSIGKDENAVAKVTGIIDGTGALGAASGQIFIGYLSDIDWSFLFAFMLLVNICAVSLLVKYAITDTRRLKKERKNSS
ncbi:unnamed protein product [Blepharisma stoltei]|uniref:Major facilitator superfamily (MFS) profile domain-containing protein n=1 Tax=Blepharisma stoltei TaxID=1481888 RepID=A0AAU9IRN6_9CILI|nr:unnamed protein product [Blepharisma stoltei]